MKTKALFISTLCLVLCELSVFAEVKKTHKVESDGFEWYLIEENGKEGATDRFGNMIIPMECKQILYFGTVEPHFLVISFENNFGIYTVNGRCIIPFSRKYTWIRGSGITPGDQINWFAGIKKEGSKEYVYALCNYRGEEVWYPRNKYSEIYVHYLDNRFVLSVQSYYSNKCGIIDINENVIVPLIYNHTVFVSWKNNEYVYDTMIDDKSVEVGKLNSIPPSENIFPAISFNDIPEESVSAQNTEKQAPDDMTGNYPISNYQEFSKVCNKNSNGKLLLKGVFDKFIFKSGEMVKIHLYPHPVYIEVYEKFLYHANIVDKKLTDIGIAENSSKISVDEGLSIFYHEANYESDEIMVNNTIQFELRYDDIWECLRISSTEHMSLMLNKSTTFEFSYLNIGQISIQQ